MNPDPQIASERPDRPGGNHVPDLTLQTPP